jgi:SAM-dependent methyltransferase
VKKNYLALRYGYRANEKTTAAEWLGLLAYLTPCRRGLLDFSVMYLPYRPSGRLLEIGCGSGRMLKEIEDLGWQVEGIDFDAAAVCNSRNKGLVVHQGRLEDRHYTNDSFDAIAMSHLIEHVPDPVGLIEECHRILKPGGTLVVVTPNCQSLGHRIYKRNWRGLEPPRHLHIFSLQSLAALARTAGFRAIRANSTIRDASGYLTASQSLERDGSYQPDGLHAHPARALQFLEWVLINLGFHVGEELTLIARKCEN